MKMKSKSTISSGAFLLSALLAIALVTTACKDNSTSVNAVNDTAQQLSPIASSSSGTSVAAGTVLLQDNFDIPTTQSGINDHLADRQAGSTLAPVNYTIGYVQQFSPSAEKVINNELMIHGNYVRSFVPDINVNTDGGFTVCLDAATSQYNTYPNSDQNAIRFGISFGHESASDAGSGYDGANNDGYLRIGGKTGTGFISGSSTENFAFDTNTQLGKSYKLSLSVATAEVAAGVGYTATLYIDGVEQGVVTGTWSADNQGNVKNFIGFHAIDGGWTVDNLKITSGAGQGCKLSKVTNTAPVADAGADRTIEATGPTTPVTLNGSATDADGDSPLTFTWSNNATGETATVYLGVGTHTFTLTVTDPQGAASSDDVTITIIDTIPPDLDYTVEKTELWSPNHKMHLVVSGISISDIADPNPSLDITVSSNESSNGRGDGNTDSDWNIIDNSDGTYDVEVRAERSGRGNGRIYTITITGTDASGNTIAKTVEVTVPHSKKGGSGK